MEKQIHIIANYFLPARGGMETTMDEIFSSLEKLANKLGVDKRVFFLGTRSVIDKYYLLKHAEMVVHMAHFESYGIVLLEAMSQGTVCITSTKFAMPYVVKDGRNGFCIDPENKEALIGKIEFVLAEKNKKIINEMKKNNITDSHSLTWDKTADDLEVVLQNCLQLYVQKI